MTAQHTKPTNPKTAEIVCERYTLSMRPPQNEAERYIGVETYVEDPLTGERAWKRIPHLVKARIEVKYPDGHTIRLAVRKRTPESRHYTVSEESSGLGALCYVPTGHGLPTTAHKAFLHFAHQLWMGKYNGMGADELRTAITDKTK